MIVGNRDMYLFYKREAKYRVNILKKRIKNLKHTINHFKIIFADNKSWIANYTNVTFTDIIKIADVSKIVVSEHIPKGEYQLTDRMFLNYVNSYNKGVRIIKKFKEEVKVLSLPYTIHSQFLKFYDLEVSEGVLDGRTHHLNSIGDIKIMEKERLFVENGIYNTKVVDWGASRKTLIAIAKEYFPDVYSKCANENSFKQYHFLRIEIKDSLYNKVTNPTGYKYIVYHISTHSYWWKWEKRGTKMVNNRYYTFVPTKYNNARKNGKEVIPNKLKEVFTLKEVKHLPIGNQQKMRLYLELDNTRKDRYKNVI